MAGSINKAIIIGNIGKEPEIRAMQDGREVATLSIATSESWKDKNSGERKEKTEWHRVVIFNEHLVRFVKEYLRKGSKVYAEGQIQTRKWTDRDGVERYNTEIVIQPYNGTLTALSKVEPSSRAEAAHSDDGHDDATAHQHQSGYADLDDEIPF